jgi:hypothetical protein
MSYVFLQVMSLIGHFTGIYSGITQNHNEVMLSDQR